MIVWRISEYADLLGIGGRYAEQRWNYRGTEIVYCSDHPATCLLELLVQADLEDLPDTYQLIEVNIPDTNQIVEADLPDDWIENRDLTRRLFQEMVDNDAAPGILRVPCALVPHARNYLLNPNHPAHGAISIMSAKRHAFNPRFEP
ncbi:MAG: RES family NAD+ phosphorylase [Pseudomonadota bacterium]